MLTVRAEQDLLFMYDATAADRPALINKAVPRSASAVALFRALAENRHQRLSSA
jgi:hypothetical protein